MEWWVTALECARAPELCSRQRRRRRRRAADLCARAPRDRSGSARRRQDNAAAGAGNDGGEHEEGTSFVTVKTGALWASFRRLTR